MVIVNPLILPPETIAVAVAVEPTPTVPSDLIKVPTPTGGAEIDIVGVEVYPDPPLTIVKSEIVPPTPTVAVNPAATGSGEPDTTKALYVSPEPTFVSKNSALSTNIDVMPEEEILPIIFAVG